MSFRNLLLGLGILTIAAVSVCAAGFPPFDGHAGRGGLGSYRTANWAEIALTLSNRTDHDYHLLLLTTVKDIPGLQFSSEAWLPAHTQRRISQPLITGTKFLRTPPRQDIVTEVYDLEHPGQRPLLTDSTTMPITNETDVTGIWHPFNDDDTPLAVSMAHNAIVGTVRLNFFPDSDLPRMSEGLDSLDTLVIARPDARLDPAQLDAARQWLLSGGHLWIMLDKSDPRFCAELLRDNWDIQVVDRVELPHVALQQGGQTWTRDLEKPAQMVRVVARGMDVLYTDQGWPVALSRTIGRGTLLVTTLTINDWLDDQLNLVTVPSPLRNVAGVVMAALPPTLVSPALMTQPVLSQIGYQIVARGPVMILLGVFLLLILGAGLLLSRIHRLEWLAPIGLVLALGIGLVFVQVGSVQRGATPATIASEQFINAVSAQPEVMVTGLTKIFNPREQDPPLMGSLPNPVMPDLSIDAGRPHRLVFTDLSRWRWEGLSAGSGGLRTLTFAHAIPLSRPVTATATFGPQGLVGHFDPGALGTPHDVVLGADSNCIPLHVGTDGSFTAGEGDILYGRGLPSSPGPMDLQAAQRNMLNTILGVPGVTTSPVILASMDGLTQPMVMDQFNQKNQAVVDVPLTLQLPVPGTQLNIPSIFMTPVTARPGQHRPTGTIYDSSHHRWGARSASTTKSSVGFQVPRGIGPVKIVSGSLRIDIDADSRQVNVLTYLGTKPVVISTLKDPTGTRLIDIPGEDLVADADGVVWVGLDIGAARGAHDIVPSWTLKGLNLELKATALGPGSQAGVPGATETHEP